MLEEKAVVIAVEGNRVELSTSIKSTCNGCEQQEGCGTGLLARYLAPKPENLTVQTDIPLSVGQKVVIAMAESALLKMAFISYIMPLLVMIFAVLGTQSMQQDTNEGIAILVGMVSMAIYYIALKHWLAQRRSASWQPRITKALPVNIETPLVQIDN